MILTLRLPNLAAQALLLLLALGLCLWLGALVQARYVIATLTAEGVKTAPPVLAAAVNRFPNSARLQAQWASSALARALLDDDALAQAETAAAQAVHLAPHNARFRLLRAATQSVSGDLAAQEEHLRAAVALAPRYPPIHWQLANLLVRAGKTEQSLAEFQFAVTARPALLPSALELLSEVSGGDYQTLSQAVGELPQNRLALAQFLVRQTRLVEAAQVFSQIERSAQLAAPETAELLSSLLAAGQPELARRWWDEMLGERDAAPALLWNGGFESEQPPGLTHFAWQLSSSPYARVALESGLARTGARALRLDFYGRDTTRLADEIKQLVVLRPGASYRLECYAKAQRLVTPEGPRLAVLERAAGQVVATTAPVRADADDWQLLAVDFTAPAGQTAFLIGVQRTPQFSYDEPTRGTIWFDDCALWER